MYPPNYKMTIKHSLFNSLEQIPSFKNIFFFINTKPTLQRVGFVLIKKYGAVLKHV